jgi:hypothetical protein
MRFLLLAPLLLTGCVSPVEPYQQVLDRYSHTAFDGDLSLALTGAALEQASQSRALLTELGWRQLGKSRFEQTRLVDQYRVSTCLDVSGVGFVDAAGVPVALDRKHDRMLMELEFSKTNPPLVAIMKEVGRC